MTQANIQGAFLKTLQVTRDGSNRSDTMLRTTFLKKLDNYTVQCLNFITNITPILNVDDEVMFRILPRGVRDAELDDTDFPIHWEPEWTEFRPNPYCSVSELADQIRLFFHRFGFLVRMTGTQNIDARLTDNQILYSAFPFIDYNLTIYGDDFENIGYTQFADNAHIITFKLLPDGRFSLFFTPEFSTNFYIQVGQHAQKKTGFAEFLFVTEGATLRTAQDGVEFLFDEEKFTYDPDVEEEYNYNSVFALDTFDDRLSLDVVMTIPLSNQIMIVDGEEEHEYILSRFPLNEYKRFDTITTFLEDRVSESIGIDEDINVGLEDLTRGNPDQSIVFPMNGDVRQISVQLYTRYYSEGIIRRIETDMDQGFWTTKLLFAKKIT